MVKHRQMLVGGHSGDGCLNDKRWKGYVCFNKGIQYKMMTQKNKT